MIDISRPRRPTGFCVQNVAFAIATLLTACIVPGEIPDADDGSDASYPSTPAPSTAADAANSAEDDASTGADAAPSGSAKDGGSASNDGGSAGKPLDPGSDAGARDASASRPDAQRPDANGPDGALPTEPLDAGANTGDAQSARPDAGGNRDGVWSPLSVMDVVNPMDHGARGDGVADDLAALRVSVDALPSAGGIVYFPSGRSFRKSDLLVITKSHVKLWSENRKAEVYQTVNGQRRRQSILCRRNSGCGVFGLKLRSDATSRFDALEDNQISADHGSLVEVVGAEIQGSAATGIFLYGSSEHYIEGNYVHHTWADHIHHTSGANASWVWNNFILNGSPSRGDDGVACVTYGPNSTRCRDMEWWRNTLLHSGWGRGYAVIGGDQISIHDNWAIGAAGAGIIVASESGFNSASSNGISISDNVVSKCGHTIGHPGILISGENSAAAPLSNISLTNNISVGTPGGAYRAEGAYTNVTNQGLSQTLDREVPDEGDIRMADTTVLRTRDVSHVAQAQRPGLHRIHVRRTQGGAFEQRFEYVVKGTEAAVSAFTAERVAAGDYLSEQRVSAGTAYALVLCAQPVSLPTGVSGVPFRELRTKDESGELTWLWERLDTGNY